MARDQCATVCVCVCASTFGGLARTCALSWLTLAMTCHSLISPLPETPDQSIYTRNLALFLFFSYIFFIFVILTLANHTLTPSPDLSYSYSDSIHSTPRMSADASTSNPAAASTSISPSTPIRVYEYDTVQGVAASQEQMKVSLLPSSPSLNWSLLIPGLCYPSQQASCRIYRQTGITRAD